MMELKVFFSHFFVKTVLKRFIYAGPSGKQGQSGIAGRPGDKGPAGKYDNNPTNSST